MVHSFHFNKKIGSEEKKLPFGLRVLFLQHCLEMMKEEAPAFALVEDIVPESKVDACESDLKG